MIRIINENILSKREKEVFLMILSGYTNKEVAKKMSISLSTVKTYVEKIYLEFDVHSRAQLILYSIKNSIISIDS